LTCERVAPLTAGLPVEVRHAVDEFIIATYQARAGAGQEM
jgi:hypothetical protein